MPDLTGRTASNVTPTRLEQMVQESVAAFEPRIMRKTLAVKAVSVAAGKAAASRKLAGLEISGELCPLADARAACSARRSWTGDRTRAR